MVVVVWVVLILVILVYAVVFSVYSLICKENVIVCRRGDMNVLLIRLPHTTVPTIPLLPLTIIVSSSPISI